VHNHGAINNSLAGGCSSQQWQEKQEADAFPTVLKAKGYSTFFAGKYLNQVRNNILHQHVFQGLDIKNLLPK